MLLLVIPYWINEILRAFAFRVLFGTGGVINAILIGARPDPRSHRFPRRRRRALCRAHLRLSADHDVPALQCARGARPQPDRGGARSRRAVVAYPLFVVMPYAKPGVASGATLVFMLCAGALAAPLILGGPNTLWFTPIVYDRFFQAFNWPQGAAYALILLAACMAFVLLVMRLFRSACRRSRDELAAIFRLMMGFYFVAVLRLPVRAAGHHVRDRLQHAVLSAGLADRRLHARMVRQAGRRSQHDGGLQNSLFIGALRRCCCRCRSGSPARS